MKRVIYETTGRAREFNELAINLFTGCGHQCTYCYGAEVTHQDKVSWEYNPQPRISIQDIERSAIQWRKREGNNPRRVLLCFVTDPYQPIETKTQFTRLAIQILHKYDFNVHILTKAGYRSMRDFDLLTPNDAYATTLTCLHADVSLRWEPNAGAPNERIQCLKEAHRLGIETWVSFEPVIYPKDTFELMRQTKRFVGHYKVGTMNYHEHGKSINWYNYGWAMKRTMDSLNVNYYFKKDLLKEMRVPFAHFEQRWICK